MIDSYQKTASAKVVRVEEVNGQTALVLDQTIFYAQGGGQPADQGKITGTSGTFDVTHVSYNMGEPQHKGTLKGEIQAGDEVKLEIDWQRRYQHMQWHTAGHIVDQAVKNVVAHSNSVDGNHGIGKKMYVEFTNQIDSSLIEKIEQEANQIIRENLPINIEMVTYQQLVERNIKLPFDLPQNKELRIVQIGEYPAMPDGGTQLKTTSECWPIKITQVIEKEGKWRVVYQVENKESETQKESAVTAKSSESKTSDQSLSLSDFEHKIYSIISQLKTETADHETLRVKYFGKKGLFNQAAKLIGQIDDKKKAGELLNDLKKQIESHLNNTTTRLAGGQAQQLNNSTKWTDLTIPGLPPHTGHMHPISQAIEEIRNIFEHIGFTCVRYPEVDWDWYAFESLNMPPEHPARDEWETFFVDIPDTTKNVPYDPNNPRMRHPSLIGGKILLTPQTSNGQVREMERLSSQPPIRMINIARCYRRQQDVTHTQMFHQFEGLVVDKGINIQHLKGTLDYFAREFYGPGTKSRIRPFHFQFTEPSFEVDFSCHVCGGTGVINSQLTTDNSQPTKCKFCKSGWHEVGGAGMVHPNVLKAGGIDPDVYTGFAFGWGVERTYTLKEGLNIDDIRLLYSSDLRFLRQF